MPLPAAECRGRRGAARHSPLAADDHGDRGVDQYRAEDDVDDPGIGQHAIERTGDGAAAVAIWSSIASRGFVKRMRRWLVEPTTELVTTTALAPTANLGSIPKEGQDRDQKDASTQPEHRTQDGGDCRHRADLE